MKRLIKIKKGLDLKIKGAVPPPLAIEQCEATEVAIYPGDFPGFTPKVEVNEGDSVEVGQALLHDKEDPEIKLTAPASGTVSAIVRAERRRIDRIIIKCDGEQTAQEMTIATDATAEQVRTYLKNSGLWAMMRQRPYDIVPEPESVARDIFVTAFDSAPLALNMAELLMSKDATAVKTAMETGVKMLGRLTSGKVYICRRPDSLPDIDGAEMIDVTGPHPAGNVGVQIANIKPVNKGETVWTLDLATLYRIGRTATDGALYTTTTVAVTGSEVESPYAAQTTIGCKLSDMLAGRVKDTADHKRYISGNVLTGVQTPSDGFLHYPYTQVTVIPEGDDVDEFMGWASISAKKMSCNRSFPGHFLFKKLFTPDARLHGGRRALIMSGEYDRYLPMDIEAEYLFKAILSHDIEKMEELGIYEVAPEDFALGEYADTSKIEAQKLIREGLDYLRKELK